MNVDVTMPQLGETVTEGTVTKWLRAVGDLIGDQEPLLEIATDKVDTEVPSPAAGRLLEIVVPEDSTVSVGTVLAVIGSEQDASIPIPAVTPEPDLPSDVSSPVATAGRHAAVAAAVGRRHRHDHSPLVRRLAREHGLALADLHGSGPGGRVTRGDVSAAAAALAREETTPAPAVVTTSAGVAAQAICVVEADVTGLVEARGDAALHGLTADVAAAVLAALRAVPTLNAGTAGQHLAFRFDTRRGSVAPVLRDAADLNEDGLGRRIAELAARSSSGSLVPSDLTGATFTLANTGDHGVLMETPVLPAGQMGALSIGSVTERPVVLRQGSERVIAIRSSTYLALTFDHGAVAPGDAARFLALVKDRLESAGSAVG